MWLTFAPVLRRPIRSFPTRLLASAVVAAIAVGACGGDGDDGSANTTTGVDAATDATSGEASVGDASSTVPGTSTPTPATEGDDPDEEDASGATATTAPSVTDGEPTEADDEFPVTIEHRHGTTTIESEPRRVVAAGLRDQDALLALGVIPVGVQDWFGDQPDAVWPWAQDELGDADPLVLDATQIDFEAIASLDPDLIVAIDSGLTPEDYELMSAIAPTVAPPPDHPDFAVPWQIRTMLAAEAVGRSELGRQIVADVEAQIAEAAAAHPEFDGATALVGLAGADGQAYAYGSDDVRSLLLVELGFSVPERVDEQVEEGSFYVTLSQENFDQLDADVLVWVGGDATSFDGVTAEPLYPPRVVDEGRDLFLPYDPLGGAMSFASALSLPFLVEELVPQLALALDGDPTTTSEYGR